MVLGNVRDVNRLVKEKWPVWCEGFNPVGCFNKDIEIPQSKEILDLKNHFQNAVAVCDDTGVVIINESYQTEEFLTKLINIEEQEDTWYDCIDRLKWNTFETICLKKYHDIN